jgi:hypothetical protein
MKGRILFATTALLMAGAGGFFWGCNTSSRTSGGDTFTDTMLSASPQQAEERLQEIVRSHISANQQNAEPQKVPVVRRRPYYFKEYALYPDSPDDFTMDIREEDSRIRPMMAEVVINKIRFSTRMHRKRNEAEADHAFLRDTGVETLAFELRNGRWTRTGAIFETNATEELIDGVWMPRRDETERVTPGADQPGWFMRLWNRVRGGE